MEEIYTTLPQHTSSWVKGRVTLYKFQDFWNIQDFLQGQILVQQSFKAQPSDVYLCSSVKTGTTWLKALAFAIVTRSKFDESTSALLTAVPHNCVPTIERKLKQIQENRKNSCFQLIATHLPYTSLPDSIIASNYVPFEEVFDEFYHGISWYGPYWNHVLGYWKASLEKPALILLLKYEDLKRDPTSNVKRLAEFMGYPFSIEEVEGGVVDKIVKLCSFENLSNLEVNKSGMHVPEAGIENKFYFRKATDGDWENYFTDEMKEKIDKLMDEKFSGTGLDLK